MKPIERHDTFYIENIIAESFSEKHLSILRVLVDKIDDSEMKARVTDLLWICKKQDPERARPIKMAREAVKGYLQSARNLESIKNDNICYARLKRAAQLASIIDGKKNTEMRGAVVEYINDIIDRYATVEIEFLTGSVMQILQEDLRNSLKSLLTDISTYAVKYANIAEQKALLAENLEDDRQAFYQKIVYRQIESEWYKIAKDKEAERNARLHLGEVEVWYAQQALVGNEPNYTLAAGEIENAIAAFKKIEDTFGQRQDTSERIQYLHKQMLDYQKKSRLQMKSIVIAKSEDFYDPEMQQLARDIVKGKSLRDALYSLAFRCRLIRTIEDIQAEAEEDMELYKSSHLIPNAFIDEEGKTKAVSGHGEDELKNTMFRTAKFYQVWYGLNFIIPACHQICSEHNVTLEDLSFVVYENPFIPEGRELFYAKGLIAGLQDDPVIAAHLLIPQLENSLRHILKQKGFITSKRETIQDDFLLHEVLRSSDLRQILGGDIIFTLTGLLVERMGSNLRNDICHGLLNYDRFFMPELAYFWWLTLYLCLG